MEKYSLHTLDKTRGIYVSPVFLNAKKKKMMLSLAVDISGNSHQSVFRLGSLLVTVANRFRKPERIYARRRLFDGAYVMVGFKK
jgi:hypothetical protein